MRLSKKVLLLTETKSKKGTNVFCVPNDTLAQGTNDANKMGQTLVWTVSCV